MTKIQLVEYYGWKNCILLENDRIKLVVTTEVGPRIINLSTKNGSNMFHVDQSLMGLTGGDRWVNFGGHRLWHGPQVGYRPEQPDNNPVDYKLIEDGVILLQPTELATGIQKELTISLNEYSVTVTHRLYNRNLWNVQLAAWALSVMHSNGIAYLPVPTNDTHYLPNYMLSFWKWTKPNDERFCITDKMFVFTQKPEIKDWFKIGLHNPNGYGLYWYDNCLFAKTAVYDKEAKYIDYGANFELFIDDNMLELETLSPLTNVKPNDFVEHTENWFLISNFAKPESLDVIIDTLKDHSIIN